MADYLMKIRIPLIENEEYAWRYSHVGGMPEDPKIAWAQLQRECPYLEFNKADFDACDKLWFFKLDHAEYRNRKEDAE